MGLIYLPERGIRGWHLPDDLLYWDKEHPLIEGALIAHAFIHGKWINLLTGGPAANPGGGCIYNSSQMGQVLSTNATSTSYYNTGITPTVTEDKISYLGTFSLNVAPANGGLLTSKNTTGNGGGVTYTSGNFFSSFEANDGTDLVSGSITAVLNKVRPFCCSVDATTNDFYIGGVKATQGTGKTCTATTLSGSATLSLGRRGTFYTKTSSNLIIVRQEKITDRQYEAFVSAPFGMFHKRRIWVPVSAGGNTALTVTDSTHAHSADVVVLSTQKLLTGLDATHAHAADAVVLSTQTVLTGVDATHGHSADAAVLAQNYTLVGTDATHGHTAGTAGCTQQAADTYALIGVDATHAHTADAVVVAHNYTLTGIDLSHAHTAEPVTLSTQNSLSVLDATHGHSAEQIILSTQVVLAALDATHGHTADAVAVSTAEPSFTPEQLAEILAYVEANMAVPTTEEIAAAVWAEILSGSSAADRLIGMAAAILAAAQAAPIHADMRKVRGQDIDGAGTEADPWGPA